MQVVDIARFFDRLEQFEANDLKQRKAVAKNEEQLMSRLDQLESRADQDDAIIKQLEEKIQNQSKQIKSQQVEIDQLKKMKEFEEKNQQMQLQKSVLPVGVAGDRATPSKPRSCFDLRSLGYTLNGFYNVQSGNNKIASVYCDFTIAPTLANLETRIGLVDVKSSPVHFLVSRTMTSNWSNAPMPFNVEILNEGGAMNLTSGVFTAPKNGIYTFFFKGSAFGSMGPSSTGWAWVNLNRNDITIERGYSSVIDAKEGFLIVSLHATVKLNIGERITIVLTGGSLYSFPAYRDTQFMGSLLEEDLVIT